jgi:hypothetical protein
MEWVWKKDINFDLLPKFHCTILSGFWILQGNNKNNELVKDKSEEDPSNESGVNVEAS